jgi:hypothetical protein
MVDERGAQREINGALASASDIPAMTMTWLIRPNIKQTLTERYVSSMILVLLGHYRKSSG